jgi:hypothetical protein
MDPLTLASGITSLIGTATKLINSFNSIRSKYSIAEHVLPAIVAECRLVKLGLTKMQRLLDANNLRFRENEDVLGVLEYSLAGCSSLLLALSDELHDIGIAEENAGQSNITRKTKFKAIWNEISMKELLTQLRAQHSGLTFVLNILQSLVFVLPIFPS